MIAFAIAALSCAGRDANVSCEPTLTCTLHDSRFDPGPEVDAGPDRCRAEDERCRASQIAAGARHACAAARAGELLCWGDDSEGQLGVGSVGDDAGTLEADAGVADEQDALDAGLRTALQHVERFAAGGAHTCALTADDELYCWGRDAEGQVDGTPADQPIRSPKRVDLPEPTAVSAGGSHTCAVAENGVWCWGSARFGQSGSEIVEEGALGPELVAGTEDAIEVAAGARHTCARTKDGHVLCWGELIDPDTAEPRATAQPELVAELDHVIEIAAGAGHSCALRDDGRVWCWGLNTSGQLGDGTTRSRATPVQVQGLERSLHIAAGGLELDGALVGHSCVETTGFLARCWGRNHEGQLGTGDAQDSATATVVSAETDTPQSERLYLDDVVGIAAGGQFSCSLDDNGPVRCWGANDRDQLGLRHSDRAVFGRPSNVRRFSRPE